MKKILILSVNPKKTAHLRLDQEVRDIKDALRLSPNEKEFEIITESAVRVDDLSRFLFHHQPTIVHFSGHGAGANGLAFEDNSGHIQLVSTQALADLFELFQSQVECVLLNACYSEEQATAIHKHIDCVMGMNQAIGDTAAIKFSVGFYTALAALRNYQDCFQMGCTSIDLQGIPESLTPVIKIRPRDYQTAQAANPVKFDKDNGMNTDNKSGQDRSVSIMGNAINNIIGTGDNTTMNANFQQVSLPTPTGVNIQAELNALREILANLQSSDRRKIDNAFDDAQEELYKPQPNKDEIGDALSRALKYAKEAEGFASAMEKLQPHLTKTTAWLGNNWHKLLSLVNLTI